MNRSASRASDRARAALRLALALAVGVLTAGLSSCAKYKKLSQGGSVPEVLVYDIFGQDRAPADYYELVRTSHKECDFCYRCGEDTFLVDKNIDAVQRLGNASFGRLEGGAQVVELLTEVLLEDCSALARSSAAGSLTKIGLKLPAYPTRGIEDRGDRFLAHARELDRLYGHEGTRPPLTPARRERAVQLLQAIGDLDIVDPVVTRDSLKFFYGRDYLVDEADPRIRTTIDTALVKRMKALIHGAMEAAVDDEVPTVRADAIRGLRLLGDRGAAEAVLARLAVEPDWLVRIEGVEYLGRVGTRGGVVALVRLLGDPNASVRHKARRALVRIAGADYGARPSGWEHWAKQIDPDIEFERAAAPEEEDDEDRLPRRGP